MFTNIYKLPDGKWHLWEVSKVWTQCGEYMTTVVESRIIGQKGEDRYPDPPKTEVCRKCFQFLRF